MRIIHHFGPKNKVSGVDVGTYIKETHFRAGETVPMHEHVHSHQSVLCMGEAMLTVDGQITTLHGPCVIDIVAGRAHEVVALTPTVWLCLHATDETDPDKIDETLIG